MMVHGSHDPLFVLLSVVIAIATAYAALNLAGRATVARGHLRVAWILGGAVAMGIGINGMHFVGMLGYQLPLPVLYHVPTVLAALLAAILASGVALLVVSQSELRLEHALIGSLFMGGGIATMHYTGMAAMRVAAVAHYDVLLVALSVVIAISVSLVGLWLVFNLRDPSTRAWWWQVGGAAVIGVAIPSMHYVAMMAVAYMPAAELPHTSYAIQISSLGALLIVATLSTILGLAVITSMVDRRLDLQAMALTASEERFSAVAETAADAIISADHHGNIVYFNPAAERIFGYAARDILGRPLTLLMAERFREAHRQGMARLLATEEARVIGGTAEFVGLKKEGTEFPLELSLASWKVSGDTFFTGIIRDITARKQAEKALADREAQLRQAQKMESVGRLAGGVAHDFNNLLTVIIGTSELVLKELPADAPIRKSLDEVIKAGHRAESLTRQLLAFSRKQLMTPIVLNLNAVATNMESMLRRLIGEDIQLTLALHPAIHLVKADPGQIEQVVMNLAVNARDAMPNGGKLLIETSNVDLDRSSADPHRDVEPGPYALLAVSDTGHGMDATTIAHLFEPFFTTKEVGKGTGLGLATVYGIVKQTGGYVYAYSEPGLGACFKIYLPQAAEALRAGRMPVPSTVPLSGGKETILLVEDEEQVRTIARVVLERQGYTVLEAENGTAALAMCERDTTRIDLILTDVIMPGMNGRALTDRLVTDERTPKVLYMSGYTDEAIVHHGVLDPNTAFLSKPFTTDGLVRKVRDVLDCAP